jgi:hypothetical protein
MAAGTFINLHRRQVPAFDAKNPAGSGKSRIPGNLKIGTLKTIRRPGGGIIRIPGFGVHTLNTLSQF